MSINDKPSSRLGNIQVMVLNGSAKASELLCTVFDKIGFVRVCVVKDGYEGIDFMKHNIVHLVVADWDLRVRRRTLADQKSGTPVETAITGADFVRRLRLSPHSPNPFVPVVMVVNDNTDENIARARDAGVNEIVSKPLDAEDLCRRIASVIDDTRYFITADDYKGPCRRKPNAPPFAAAQERRKRQVRLVRRSEGKRTILGDRLHGR